MLSALLFTLLSRAPLQAFDGPSNAVRIPFELTKKGQIVAQVSLEFEGGQRVAASALLDTGSSESWIDPSVVPEGVSSPTNGLVGVKDASGQATILKLSKLKARWVLPGGGTRLGRMHLLDLKPLDPKWSTGPVSILGLDALGSGRFAIDLEHRELVFNDEDVYSVSMPFSWKEGTVYLDLPTSLRGDGLERPSAFRYLVDTGQSSAIQLPGSCASQFKGLVYWESGFFTLLGTSVPCKIFPYGRVKLGGEWVGPFEVWVGGAGVEPSIGVDFFRHCKVQFDFEHRVLRIKRYPAFGSAPFAPLSPLTSPFNP